MPHLFEGGIMPRLEAVTMAGQDHAENLVDGHRVLPRLLADLGAARRAIHLSIFLFFNDAIGKAIAAVLRWRERVRDPRTLLLLWRRLL